MPPPIALLDQFDQVAFVDRTDDQLIGARSHVYVPATPHKAKHLGGGGDRWVRVAQVGIVGAMAGDSGQRDRDRRDRRRLLVDATARWTGMRDCSIAGDWIVG